MDQAPAAEHAADAVEQALRDDLARGDRALAAARLTLGHLLTHEGPALFDEEVVARVRGMTLDLARRLVFAAAEGTADPRVDAGRHVDDLAEALLSDAGLLAHAHALALEGRLTERLRAEQDIDPVLPPLVQDLAADAETAGLAMAVLAAQARFLQQYHRMELPLGELPGELFHRALLALRTLDDEDASRLAAARLREGYDEAAGRLALVARMVTGLDRTTIAELTPGNAGVAIFASSLALTTGQAREDVLLSLAGAAPVRLALSLRAIGLQRAAIDERFLQIGAGGIAPEGIDAINSESAAGLLATAPSGAG